MYIKQEVILRTQCLVMNELIFPSSMPLKEA